MAAQNEKRVNGGNGRKVYEHSAAQLGVMGLRRHRQVRVPMLPLVKLIKNTIDRGAMEEGGLFSSRSYGHLNKHSYESNKDV